MKSVLCTLLIAIAFSLTASAQPARPAPIVYELACPAGYSPVQTGGRSFNSVTGLWRANLCISDKGDGKMVCQMDGCNLGGAGVTSVGLAGTANQITVTGTSPIITSGSFTLSLPSSLVLPNGAAATTQNIGDATTKVASDAFVVAESNIITGSLGISAAAYGAVGEGHFYFDATWTTGSAIVTCPDCNFTVNAVPGQIVFGTGLTQAGGFGMTSTVVQLHQTTILSVDSATQIHVTSSSGITTNSGNGFLVWGTDESTQLANAWAATIGTCGALILPGFNPEQTGPAVILVQSAQLSSASAKCNGTGGTYAGETVKGVAINASIVMITPNFSAASCTFGVSGHACFLATPDGINAQSFQIHGAGNSNPGAGFASVVGVEMSLLNGAYMSDMAFTAWGANGTNGINVGFQMDGGGIQIRRVQVDGFGSIGCKQIASTHYASVLAEQLVCVDAYYHNLLVNNDGKNPFLSSNSSYGWVNKFTNYASAIAVAGTGGTAIFYSDGDTIGTGDPSVSIGENGLLIGEYYLAGVATSGAAEAYIHNDFIGNLFTIAGVRIGGSNAVNLHLSGTYVGQMLSGGGATVYLNNSSSTLYDEGGNTFGVGTALSVITAGNVVGSLSITGTVITAGKAVLSGGWGSTAAWTGLAGYNNFSGTITASGSGQGANPTVTYTFPSPFLAAPSYCIAQQVGGTQALGSFDTSSLTATGAVFTYSGTPGAGNTVVATINCVTQ